MTIRDEEINIGKLQFHKDRDESVHLTLRSNSPDKPFRNGLTKKIDDNSIVFNDEKLGIILIYISEIIDVEKREEKR